MHLDKDKKTEQSVKRAAQILKVFIRSVSDTFLHVRVTYNMQKTGEQQNQTWEIAVQCFHVRFESTEYHNDLADRLSP